MELQKLRAQNKLVDVNQRLGNDFLKRMQGTTKMIWDTLEITGQRKYTFFEETQTRSFPFTNVKNDSLPVGESLAVQRISLAVLTVEETEDGVFITDIDPIESLNNSTLAGILAGTLALDIANDVVMKPIAIQHFLPAFNKTSQNDENSIFEFNTDLVIPPQLDFSFELHAANHVPIAEKRQFIRLIIEGVGSQFNGKTNF
jgi:hypothetical protein